MSSNRSRTKKSKSKRRKSYLQHYEASLNNLLEAFETNLSISPILPNKSLSKLPYQSEEKDTENESPKFSLSISLQTDEIPRIQEIQHEDIYDNNTEPNHNNIQSPQNNTNIITHNEPINSNINNIQSPQKEDNINNIEEESDCNESKQLNTVNNVNNNTINIMNESHQFIPQQLQQQQPIHNAPNTIPNTPIPQLSQTMQFIHPQNQIHNQSIQHQQFSQSYDISMQHNIYQPMQHIQSHHMNTQSQQQQQYMQNINNINNISHFQPQKLVFPSNSSSLNLSVNNLQSNHNHINTNQNANDIMNSMKISPNTNVINNEISNKHLNNNMDINIDIDLDIEEEEDENLYMPITPTLSGSALRALLSQLRRKCKMFDFKCKQQRKYIINVQNDINFHKNEISNNKLKIYNYEQSILMLQNQNDMSSLEYLRGAELHQTRQELSFMIDKLQQLESDNLNLKQQMKLQQLDHETYNKSLKEEYQRLLREINQHKVLFDQRTREIKELKINSDNQNEEYDTKLNEINKIKEETYNKLVIVTEKFSCLQNNYENIENKYDVISEENNKLQKLNKDFELELDERDQNIISLKRVKNNLEQEIDALCRSNRNFREIRNKSTSQLLESQQYEIDTIKKQISEQYDKYLEEEKCKNDKLESLLQEKDIEIDELHKYRMENNKNNMNDNYNYNETIEMLEIENSKLRKKLKENKYIQVDPYNCNSESTTSMDEFGMLMLKSAKEEIEQLRQTNEKLMKLHAKNHFKKPRIEEKYTQTYDGTEVNSPNSSFSSIQTQKYFENFNNSPIRNKDRQLSEILSSPTKSEKVLINDVSIVSSVNNSFTKS